MHSRFRLPMYTFMTFFNSRKRVARSYLAFRAAMDGLYSQIVASLDTARAKDSAILAVENALRDVHRVVGEAPWKRALSSLKVELSAADLAIAGTLLHHPIAKIVGAAAASLKVGSALVAGFKNPVPGLRDYAYLGYATRDLGASPTKNQLLAKHGHITTNEGRSIALGVPRVKIGRNEPCFCGSGKKFKKCHGAP